MLVDYSIGFLSFSNSHSLIGASDHEILPSLISLNLNNNLVKVVFPDPVKPTGQWFLSRNIEFNPLNTGFQWDEKLQIFDFYVGLGNISNFRMYTFLNFNGTCQQVQDRVKKPLLFGKVSSPNLVRS